MNETFVKLANKLNISLVDARNIVLEEHLLTKILPKSNLKKVDLKIDLESWKCINKIAKTLKVSPDAVVCSLLRNYIRLEKLKKQSNEA